MSGWLQIERGLLNVGMALSITDQGPVRKGSGLHRWRIVDSGGNSHTVEEAEDTLLDAIASSSPVIPGSGQLIELWADPDNPAGFEVVKLPIVGWRYASGQTLPLVPGATVNGQYSDCCMQLVELSDGRCVDVQADGSLYDDLAAASDAFVKRQSFVHPKLREAAE